MVPVVYIGAAKVDENCEPSVEQLRVGIGNVSKAIISTQGGADPII